MECKELQKTTHLFIEDKLNSKDTIKFIEHINNCPICKEDLAIEYLVVVGIKRLDSESTFDLQNEITETIETRLRKAKLKIKAYNCFMVFVLLVAILIGYLIA